MGVLGKTYDSEVCSAARALEVVGERWSLLIVRKAMFGGARRFGDFRSLGIATNVLQSRLDGFVEVGVMDRVDEGGHPSYVLTEKGHSLQPILVALTEWGDRWSAPLGPPVRYVHEACGGEVAMETRCVSCGAVDDLSQIRADPGPGMPAEIAAKLLARRGLTAP